MLCVSPLTSLMMNQRNKYAPKGLSTEFVSGQQADPNVTRRILEGEVQLVFITPESIIENSMYRNMLLSQPYSNKLVALVVDEAHCVKLWGEKFRKVFGGIRDLRNLVSRSVNAYGFDNYSYSRNTFYGHEKIVHEQSHFNSTSFM